MFYTCYVCVYTYMLCRNVCFYTCYVCVCYAFLYTCYAFLYTCYAFLYTCYVCVFYTCCVCEYITAMSECYCKRARERERESEWKRRCDHRRHDDDDDDYGEKVVGAAPAGVSRLSNNFLNLLLEQYENFYGKIDTGKCITTRWARFLKMFFSPFRYFGNFFPYAHINYFATI